MDLISLATQERLKTLTEKLGVIAGHRMEGYRVSLWLHTTKTNFLYYKSDWFIPINFFYMKRFESSVKKLPLGSSRRGVNIKMVYNFQIRIKHSS